jgi:hypothetical protein
MTATILILAALGVVGLAAWSEHFHGQPWRQGLDRMLGRPLPPIAGGSDRGLRVGDTFEIVPSTCDLCQHPRSSHIDMESHLFQSREMRCERHMGRTEMCRCRRFTTFSNKGQRNAAIPITYFLQGLYFVLTGKW